MRPSRGWSERPAPARPHDPDRAAAGHLLAPLTGPLEHRPDADVREVAAEAVDVFPHAYGT
ncbi:hypothetical protein DR950_01875 [Kitasatospora xanthocidica]|uniref:Uncharacterized protein n=1 Tax=Kitasatospora xanthocidica TaxID=83382 RepID=A0A372ZLJ1_9ACTN|nr:hypothetical protein [Kitasatospora xanthocidica]RGD56706.1 hypothetical protein DR950_01875 [Kitasatospora xanthocidica]